MADRTARTKTAAPKKRSLTLKKETVRDLAAPARTAKAIRGGALTAAACQIGGNDAGTGITDPQPYSGDRNSYVSTVWVKR